MAVKADITPDLIRKLLDYDPYSGKLFWQNRPVDMFENGTLKCANLWNAAHAGKEAFTNIGVGGYLRGTIRNMSFPAHRVIYAWVHGEWPDLVDHINGVRSDNRIANLRSVSAAENSKNVALRCDNSSGHAGVYKRQKAQGYHAQIKHAGKTYNLGSFATLEDAASARANAELHFGFSSRHGRR